MSKVKHTIGYLILVVVLIVLPLVGLLYGDLILKTLGGTIIGCYSVFALFYIVAWLFEDKI